jgi:nucleoside-diphosphate-sugar epimerase
VKILITGAAGFLGGEFARAHAARGDIVHGLDDLSASHAQWVMEDNVNNVKGDAGLFFDGWSDKVTSTYDVVYHFAAPVGGRERIENDPLFNADSLRLDSSLFRWAAKFGQDAIIVYPSSSAVYGVSLQGKEGRPLTEGDFDPSDTSWGQPDEVYGLTKMVGEVLAHKAANYGANTLCIRPFSGYGERQSLDYPVPAICKRAAERNNPLVVWGSGLQARDFIHVDDVVGATLARVDAGVEGYDSMNIGTGEFRNFNQIAKVAAYWAGYDPAIENLEDRPQGVDRRYCDPARMLTYYTPVVTLDDGLRRVMEAHESEA